MEKKLHRRSERFEHKLLRSQIGKERNEETWRGNIEEEILETRQRR